VCEGLERERKEQREDTEIRMFSHNYALHLLVKFQNILTLSNNTIFARF